MGGPPSNGDGSQESDSGEDSIEWSQYGKGIESKSDLVNNGDSGKVVEALGDGNIKTKDIPVDRLQDVVPHTGEKQVGKLQPNQIKKGNWNEQGMTEKVRGLGDKVQHIPPDQASPQLVNEMTGEQREELDGEQWQSRYRYFTIPKLTITAPVITTANRMKGSA